jgi:hypothetical protein
MQHRVDFLVFQHSAGVIHLVGGLEKRVIAVNGSVLCLNDVLDRADRLNSDISVWFGGRCCG